MATQYRIGEFAELGGVSTRTLRFYDKIGLLRPAGVDPRTRYRLYLSWQLEDLASILSLKEVGLSLDHVRGLLNKTDSKTGRREILNEVKTKMEQSIRSTRLSLTWINAALDELDRSERQIPVVVKRRPAVLIASIRSRVGSYTEMERFEEQLLKALPTHAIGDLRGVLWHRCADSGSLEGEAFVALKCAIPSRGAYDLKQLSPGYFACSYSKPDDESAERAYNAIRNWMNVRQYRLAGAKREIYLPEMLEIQFPLESCRGDDDGFAWPLTTSDLKRCNAHRVAS